MTSLKTSIKTITYLSDIGCLEIQGASLDTGKTVLKNQTADGLYYAVRYLSYMASATVRPEQEALPQWQPGEATRWDAGLLAGS